MADLYSLKYSRLKADIKCLRTEFLDRLGEIESQLDEKEKQYQLEKRWQKSLEQREYHGK